MDRNLLRSTAVCSLALGAALAILWLGACAVPGEDAAMPEDPSSRFVPELPTAEKRLEIDAIDKIDVLFVVDSSGSMKEEQQALAQQFPVVARALATGDVDGDGAADFPPPRDVQFGVVSTDMGLPGISGIDKCEGVGADGLLVPASRTVAPGCSVELPAFVGFEAEHSDLDQVASEFACMAQLGTNGCGFEQPLEATLKSLWPAGDDRVDFLGPGVARAPGHGDAENAGFSRADPDGVPSLLVIVAITDEEDCSAFDTSLFTPTDFLLPGDPRAEQPLNLRCFYNQDKLYPIERYANALQLLRPGAPQLVMFTAIAGVPPDRVDRSATGAFDPTDAHARDAFYRELLDDERMQERIDPATTSTAGGGNLTPVCETETAKAYPARRIVQLAQRFGENGTVQSICQQDFSDVLRFILERIAHRMRNPS
jgi:hypothetical protein